MPNKNLKNFDSIRGPKTSKIKVAPIEVEKSQKPVIKTIPAVEEKVSKKDKTKIKFFTKKRVITSIAIIFSILFLIAGFAGALYAEERMFQNKTFPGVTIWGEEMGGKTVTEIQETLHKKINEYKLSLKGPDQDYVATAEDIGIIIDTETIALSAYSKGRSENFFQNQLTKSKLLLKKIKLLPKFIAKDQLEIPFSYTLDENRLTQYAQKISDNVSIKAQDSSVSVENGSTKLVPAIYGREINLDQLKDSLANSIDSLKPASLEIKTNVIKPNIVDDAAKEVMIQTESVINRPVTLMYEGQEFIPNKETISSWINYIKEPGSNNYKIVLDTSKMKNYFNFIESKINKYSVPKKVRVENGVKETVIQEGIDGLLVDVTKLGNELSVKLPVQSSVKIQIPMYVSKFKTEVENIVVADWDKYIDINVSTQTMTAYLKGGEVVGSWAVTTGKNSTPTPIGTWLIHGKSAVTRMTGGTRGIDYYDLPNVHWVSWFKGGGYSIHEAYWRSVFGGSDYTWSGSHGCVNSPYDVAKFIYDWAPIGTPVIVHY